MYSKEQMMEASKFGWFHGNDSAEALRDGFESWLQAITPEPSADVVERIKGAMQGPIVSGLAKWRRDELVGILATIIEAEVQRRVGEYRKALEDHLEWMNQEGVDAYGGEAQRDKLIKSLGKGADDENRQ